ncbi:MAG: creatininase family protein [Anderseniella sp.]|jgi:creatinine amidohydrolase|nr:creatininase family protein [Anderseniella sp.]
MAQSVVETADTSDWIAVLPVAATEQHGPHLPASTDADIARAMVAACILQLPPELPATFLPVEEIGWSAEHGDTPGTVSAEPGELVEKWLSTAEGLKQQGLRKLVIVSSHGGNTPVVDTVIMRARAELGMLCVATAWSRFGTPPGLFSEDEVRLGIHGGDIETSIMLAHCPASVKMDKALDFSSLQQQLAGSMKHLRAYGPHRFGWMMHDLNRHGVTGNAAAATADKGRAVIAHQSAGFIELLEDVHRFKPGWTTC